MQMYKRYIVKDFGDIVTGNTPSTTKLDYWNGDIPFYSPADFTENAYCGSTEKTITKLGLKQGKAIPINSVMVTCIASIGKMAINDKIGITNQQINTIIPYEQFDYKYLYYLINQNIYKLANTAPQTAVPIINKTEFEKTSIIGLVDKTQQQKIANILSTCDEVIEKTQETIEKYKQIKAGMMQDLFTRGLDENGKLRPTYTQAPDLYKYSTELDRYIPKEWSIKRLDEIVTILSGKDYKGNPKGNCNIPIYGTGGIMGYTTIPLYSGPAVLTGRKGSINTPYYVEGDFWNVDTIFFLKMLDDNNALWFYYQIYITDMTKYNEATGVPSTTSKTLNKILFAVPKSPEQIKIANSITKFDKKIEVEEQYLNKYKQIKQGLMKKLLTPPENAEIVEE